MRAVGHNSGASWNDALAKARARLHATDAETAAAVERDMERALNVHRKHGAPRDSKELENRDTGAPVAVD